MRESVSDSKGILRTRALGHIRSFFAFNHIAFENCLVKVVLPALEHFLFLDLASPSVQLWYHFLILPANLLSGASREVVLEQSEVRTILLYELDNGSYTS